MLYISLYFLLVILSFLANQNTQRPMLYFLFLFLLIFAGTREWTGCDFYGYLSRFEDYKFDDISAYFGQREFLFIALNFALIWLDLDYMWLNVAASFIFLTGLFAFARRRENAIGYLALTFPILIVQLGMSGIRQAIAVGLVMLALNAFVDGKRIMMATFIVIAAYVHTSAIIFLPLVLVIGRTPSVWRLSLATLIVAPVAWYLTGEGFEDYQTRYLDQDIESFGAIYRVGLILITAVFFQFYERAYQKFYAADFALMRIFSIASFGLVATFFVSSLVAHRIGYYILPVQLITLARLPYVMQPKRREALIALAPYLVYGAYITVWFTYSRHAKICYLPYDSYLF